MNIRTAIIFCGALMLAPSVASAEFITNIPWHNLASKAPVVPTASSLWNNGDGTVRACISFRNVSNKPATAIRFTFEFDDLFNQPLREAVIERQGSFGPGILIEGKMDVLGGNSDSFNNCKRVQGTSVQPSSEKIDVTNVVFADGTKWTKGESFTQAFDARGNAVTQTVTTGTASGGTTSVQIGGATAFGGTVGPAGNLFGTIAWVPGSKTAYGAVTDAATQDEADFTAMTACTKNNNGNPGCKIAVRMFGADKRCGAVATDTLKTADGRGPDTASTIQSVLAALAKAGGTIDAGSVVASRCNAH
ncbi:MAG TPA: DUF4189 domain-containing protein [Candidatus Elarobacter sp.]|jgi:hypothetical protein